MDIGYMMLGDVRFEGGYLDHGFALQTLDGWYSTPEVKTALTELVNGDGAHDVRNSDIQYSARTVKGNLLILADTRLDAVAMLDDLQKHLGKTVRMRVVDVDDTYCDGYISFSHPETWGDAFVSTFTFVANKPARLSTNVRETYLQGIGRTGGFEYPVEYPIEYGSLIAAQNTALLQNLGGYRADVDFTVQGDFPGGFSIIDGDSGITYRGAVYAQAPVTISTKLRDATQNGVSRGNLIDSFDDFRVPAKGTRSVTFIADGTGWCKCAVHDTYM